MSYEAAKALLSKSVSRPTLYSVQMPEPVVTRQVNDYLNFFVKEVSIPAVSATTIAVNGHENMGIVREQTTGIVYGKPLQMTVIEDSDFTVYKAMREWFDALAINANQAGGLAGQRSLRMTYYDSYTFDMEIKKLEFPNSSRDVAGSQEANANYKNPITVKFINAYPVNISQINMQADAYDAFTSFQIAFSYESYSVIRDDGTIGQLVGGFFG